MPGGICFSTVCETAVIWASATADVDLRLEENFHHAVIGHRLRLDMLDVVHFGQRGALIIIDDAARHVVRRQAVVCQDHRNDRDANCRKNIDRRADPRHDAENDDEHRHNDERIRPLERDADESEHYTLQNYESAGRCASFCAGYIWRLPEG